MHSRYDLRKSSKERIGFVLFAIFIGSVVWLTDSSASNSSTFPTESPQVQNTKQRPSGCPSCPPPSARRIYAPAIELNEAQTCEIVLNSRSAHPIDVTPTFYTASGDAVVANPIQLQPAEIQFVPVEQLMPESLRGRHRWGGIALSYTGHVLEVWAQITFHGIAGGSIDETFNILEEPGSDTREAVWLMPRRSTAIIALGNSSSTAIHTTAQFASGDSEAYDIPAGVTRFVRHHAPEGSNDGMTSDSAKLTTSGPEGSLRVAGFIVGDDDTFASSIRFYDTKKTVQPNLYAVNLRLKNATPRIVSKNTSDTAISAQPRFFSAAGEQGSPVELPSMTLSPQQIIDVDLGALRQAAASRTDLDSVSVQIVNSGAPGSLIGAAYSTDRATGLTYDVPLRDSGKVRNATGSYPWRVDDDYSTIVVLTNVGNQPARFQVELRYPGGPYSIKQKELAVGEAASFDLREIRDEQQPDRVGKTLPLTLDRGQFHWSIVATPGEARIIGRAEVVSGSGRVASSYSCPVCCPDSGPAGHFDPNAYGLSVDGFVYTNAYGDYYDCYYNYYPGSLSFSQMFTYNTSIATVNGSTDQLNGIAVGETEVEGDYNYVEWYNDGMDCYQYNGGGSSNAHVAVLSVVLAMRSSGTVSSDNSAGSTYSSQLGTTSLGVFFGNGIANNAWRVSGVEIVGTVIPSSYTGLVVIHRTLIESRWYTDNNPTPFQTITNQPDTSLSEFRDDNPQSGGSNGKVYDLDAPGFALVSNAPVGSIVRRRMNFVQYTTVGNIQLSGSTLYWFARQSVIRTSTGDQLLNDISGDNTVGSGSTALTWNLQ